VRSAYTLLDFGNWIDGSSNQGTPYIQMSSLVDIASARNDFVQIRLAGTDTISDSKWSLLPADQIQHSPISADEKKKKYQEMILSRWPYIFVGCLAFIIIVTGLIIWKCCCKRKKKQSDMDLGPGGKNGKKGLFPGKRTRDSYVPLEAQNRSVADLNAPYPPNTGNYNQTSTPPYTGRQSFQSQYSGHNQGHHSQYDVSHQGGHNPQYANYGNGNRGYEGQYQA
jgi:hypothetical protein